MPAIGGSRKFCHLGSSVPTIPQRTLVISRCIKLPNIGLNFARQGDINLPKFDAHKSLRMAALAGFAAGFALIPVCGTAATITPTPTGQPSPTEAAAPAVVPSPTAAANQVPSEQTEPSPDSNPSPQQTATTKPTATTAPSPTPTPTEGPTLTPTPAFSPSDVGQVSAEQLAEDLRNTRFSIRPWRTEFSIHTIPYDEVIGGGRIRTVFPPWIHQNLRRWHRPMIVWQTRSRCNSWKSTERQRNTPSVY